MHALEQTDPGEKWVRLTISEKEHRLLLQLENPTKKIPAFSDGIPVSGNCFLLRIII